MKHFAEEANLTHYHSFTNPPLKASLSFMTNVELQNATISSLGKSIPSPMRTNHTLKYSIRVIPE